MTNQFQETKIIYDYDSNTTLAEFSTCIEAVILKTKKKSNENA